MNQIEGTGVSRRFGTVVAVSGVDIEVASGEVVGLVGANGAGKTTLIRVLLGILPPTAGTALLFGRPPTRAARARVGYVPQAGGLYDDLTVAENLRFVRQSFGVAGPTEIPRDLAGSADTLAGDLSLGIRRRVAFLVAMSHDPELLVLDEPTSGVDPLARTRLWDTIRSAAERGLGVLVTTHHMSEASQCDRLVVLADGRVAASGTQEAIIAGARVVEVSAERWTDAFAALDAAGLLSSLRGRKARVVDAEPARVRSVLDGAGIPADVATQPATLDEAFVRLTASRDGAPSTRPVATHPSPSLGA
jgi:ABC-2 type transport system ATP-binding protein/ribosome-dependent ATPase